MTFLLRDEDQLGWAWLVVVMIDGGGDYGGCHDLLPFFFILAVRTSGWSCWLSSLGSRLVVAAMTLAAMADRRLLLPRLLFLFLSQHGPSPFEMTWHGPSTWDVDFQLGPLSYPI